MLKVDTQEKHLDSLFIQLVPNRVKDNPDFFKDTNKVKLYSLNQAQEFLDRLPRQYKGKVRQVLDSSDSALFKCSAEQYGLMIGFRPGYQVYFKSKRDFGRYFAPVFDLGFKNLDQESSRLIIRSALNQFYGVIDGGDRKDIKSGAGGSSGVAIKGMKGKKVVQSGLEVLANFLSPGWILRVKTDDMFTNGGTCYWLNAANKWKVGIPHVSAVLE